MQIWRNHHCYARSFFSFDLVDDDGSGGHHDGRADHGEDETTWTEITWFWCLQINIDFVPLRRSLSRDGEAHDELDRRLQVFEDSTEHDVEVGLVLRKFGQDSVHVSKVSVSRV